MIRNADMYFSELDPLFYFLSKFATLKKKYSASSSFPQRSFSNVSVPVGSNLSKTDWDVPWEVLPDLAAWKTDV